MNPKLGVMECIKEKWFLLIIAKNAITQYAINKEDQKLESNMPYIPDPIRRAEMDKILELMKIYEVKADGDLNYLLFKYYKYSIAKGYNSTKNYNGELNECVAEIRRRLLGPYEDIKIKENGDV